MDAQHDPRVVEVHRRHCGRRSDPWVSAGIDGTVYCPGLAPHFQGTTPLSAVVASRSRDGGRTWREPVTLSSPAEGNEMPAITASLRRPGRAYAVWAEFATGAIKFSKTNDRGATWSLLSSSIRRSRTRLTLCPGS